MKKNNHLVKLGGGSAILYDFSKNGNTKFFNAESGRVYKMPLSQRIYGDSFKIKEGNCYKTIEVATGNVLESHYELPSSKWMKLMKLIKLLIRVERE